MEIPNGYPDANAEWIGGPLDVVVQICDIYNVPPHLIYGAGAKPHRYTWRVRRWLRTRRK